MMGVWGGEELLVAVVEEFAIAAVLVDDRGTELLVAVFITTIVHRSQ
jgi:hypothetical protein